MALPKLNQTFNFSIKVPSLKKTFPARAYLTKEEKILLFAAESNDPKEFLKATKQIIRNCVDFGEKHTVDDLAMFDLEYVFLKLRSFSVGETTNIKSKCSVCNEYVDHTIDIRNIELNELDNYRPIIDLGSGVKMQLRCPSVDDIIDKAADTIIQDKPSARQLFDFLLLTIDKVYFNEEMFDFKSEPKKEQEAFIDQFTQDQLMKVGDFINNLPKVTLVHKFNHCEKDQELVLEGLQDFFS